jgi:hypothetical protein
VFTIFFSLFFSLNYKISLIKKLSCIVVLFVLFSMYQGVKTQYRKLTWNTELSTSQKLETLSKLFNKDTFLGVFNTDIKSNRSIVFTMNRFNQGWQTSRAYRHVPDKVDYQYGLDFLNDLWSSIVPRVLWKDKRVVNDPERFTYYTGFEFDKPFSVNIGVLGDFYVNFGKAGTVVAMFLFGLFAAWLKRLFVVCFVNTNPINLIWLPFIFAYFIRPGNEFYMVFNHIIKSIVILVIVFLALYPALGIKQRRLRPSKD